jgi:hypothetical protein
VHRHQHHAGGIDQEVRLPFAPACVNQKGTGQGQQEQGPTKAKRSREQKRHRANCLDRPQGESMPIGWAETEGRVDTTPKQGESENDVEDQKSSPDLLRRRHPTSFSSKLSGEKDCLHPRSPLSVAA